MKNLLDSIKFEISCDDLLLGKKLHTKVFSICRNDLEPAIDRSLKSAQISNRLKSITLDLGTMSYSSMDSQLIPKLIAALEDELRHIENQNKEELLFDRIEVVKLFLEKGVRHWAISGMVDVDLYVGEALKKQWLQLYQFLVKSKYQESLAVRLSENLGVKTFGELIRKLQPSDADFIIDFIDDINQTHGHIDDRIISKPDMELSIRALVILDLIRNSGSLFNRKMFLQRQLLGLSIKFKMDYSELLVYLDGIIESESISYRFHSTLPALIKVLLTETITLPAQVEVAVPLEQPWEVSLKSSISVAEKEQINAHWKSWKLNYEGEMRRSILGTIRTTQQIEYILDNLSQEQTNDVIIIVNPKQGGFAIAYKKVALQSNLESSFIKSNQATLERKLNLFILSYILFEKGSEFNRKQFLQFQIHQLGRQFGVKYSDLLHFLVIQTGTVQGSEVEFGMFRHLKNLEGELDAKIETAQTKEITESDELEFLYHYLISGNLKWSLVRGRSYAYSMKTFVDLLSSKAYDSSIVDFLKENNKQIQRAIEAFPNDFFEAFMKMLFRQQLGLSKSEIERLIDIVTKNENAESNRMPYRNFIYVTLLKFKRLTKKDLNKYDLDTIGQSGSIIINYFIKHFTDGWRRDEKKHETPWREKIHQAGTPSTLITKLLSSPDVESEDFQKEELNQLVDQLITSQIERKYWLKTLSKKQFALLLNDLNSINRSQLIQALGDVSPLVKILWLEFNEKLEEGTSEYLDFWSSIFALDLSQTTSKLVLRIEGLMKKINTPFSTRDEVISKLKGSIDAGQSQELLIVQAFLLKDQIPKGWSIDELEFLILESIEKKNSDFFSILRSSPITASMIENWVSRLNENVLLRFVQLLVGSGLNRFMTDFTQIDRLFQLALDDSYARKFDSKEKWIRRLSYAIKHRRAKKPFENLVEFQLRELSENSINEFKKLTADLYLGMIKVLPEIQPRELKAKAERIVLQVKEPDPKEPLPHSAFPDEEDDNEITYSVQNAGLILLWPYFSRLFEMLEFLDSEKQFKDRQSQSKAIRLLQLVATEDESEPEYNLTLNKLICGATLQEPIERVDKISENQKSLAIDMIEGAIANWKQLGETSVAGFRNSFLIRNGSLIRDDKNWTLEVEKKGIDVLLDSIPWGFSSVKLPWMDSIVYVSWR